MPCNLADTMITYRSEVLLLWAVFVSSGLSCAGDRMKEEAVFHTTLCLAQFTELPAATEIGDEIL